MRQRTWRKRKKNVRAVDLELREPSCARAWRGGLQVRARGRGGRGRKTLEQCIWSCENQVVLAPGAADVRGRGAGFRCAPEDVEEEEETR